MAKTADKIKFVLNGCDVQILAEAPKDITLEQLLKQCDRINPYYCACGICSVEKFGDCFCNVEVSIGYDGIDYYDERSVIIRDRDD